MASKAKTIGSTEPQAETVVEEREGLTDLTLEQEIRDRAYEIFLQRGGKLAMKWMIGFRPNVSSLRNQGAASQKPSGRINFDRTQSDLVGDEVCCPNGRKLNFE